MSKLNRTATTAARLKTAMAMAKVKQQELADLTGLNKGTISRYCSGEYEPKANAISRLASALDVSEMWLWGYDVPMDNKTPKPAYPTDLTSCEKVMLELFRQIPESQQQMLIRTVRGALGIKE